MATNTPNFEIKTDPNDPTILVELRSDVDADVEIVQRDLTVTKLHLRGGEAVQKRVENFLKVRPAKT